MKKSCNWLFDYPNLQIYQYEEGFKFSLDSILLAEFAEIKKSDTKIIDLCTGNAVIPIILYYKFKKDILGVEVQDNIFSLAQESVKKNQMEEHISILHKNVLDLKDYFPGNNFDVVLCNPPYFKYQESSHVNLNEMKRVARHEILISLEQIMEVASYLLKEKGKFYLVHVPNRIDEIFIYAHQFGMAVKELQFIHSKLKDQPVMVLVTLVKGGHFGTKVYAPKEIQNCQTYQNLFRKG